MTRAKSRGPALHGKVLGRGVTGSIGTFVVRRARLVLVAAMLAVVGFGVLGVGAFGKLKTGGFADPGAGSTTAQTLTDQRFGGSDGVVLLVHAEAGTVDGASARAAGAHAASRLAAVPGVSNVVSYWQTHNPGLRSKDGKYALILGSTRSGRSLSSSELASLRSHSRQVEVTVGGSAAISNDIKGQVTTSLRNAERIAVPIILALLAFAFGSVVAALLPLAVGVIAILGTFAELDVLGSVTNVAIYAVNLTTALGLALAIDYALLMISRFREELAAGREPSDAVVRSVQTAGRTILFSGATVVAALSVLLIFPLYFLRSFAYAGIGVVLILMAAAVVVLPALLAVLGRRVNSGRLPWARKREPSTAAPFWGRLAGQVMRRPGLIAIPVLAVLMLLALPLRHVQFGTPDDRVLPTTTQSRAVGDVLREDFTGNSATALNVITDGPLDRAALTAYATRLSDLAGVVRVETSVATFLNGKAVPNSANPTLARPTAQRLAVVSAADPRSNASKDLVRTVRDLPNPDGVRVYVGGQTAELIDTMHAIGTRLPLAGLLIVLTTFIVLFLFTGSVVQPIRSLLLNSITLAATAGLMVWIFQEGHLSGPLHFTALPLDTSMLVLLFCIAFGLSMDYEVIVLSRIKELHDQGRDNRTAVTDGLTHSGRIVTTAAALIAVTFFANGTATVSFLQLLGIGAGFAVIVDATLVRAVLVPACQRILGRAAWYAPAPLRRLNTRIGLTEASG
ncbi:MAG TPA: MMPL family transporter [Streptosporangiaceae bacterium]|nr:MMPL family transporter [Streptosporangiaceae bacterium]